MTRVYIVESNDYPENSYIMGIFDSPERAMAAIGGKSWRKTTWTDFPFRADGGGPDLTRVEHRVSWDNEIARIWEMDFTDTGPLRSADEAVVQTYRESDGGWDYIPEPA